MPYGRLEVLGVGVVRTDVSGFIARRGCGRTPRADA